MPDVTPADVGYMLVLHGLNWSYGEIGDHLGFDNSTVGDHIRRVEEESKAEGVDPMDVYIGYVMCAMREQHFPLPSA